MEIIDKKDKMDHEEWMEGPLKQELSSILSKNQKIDKEVVSSISEASEIIKKEAERTG